VNILQTFQSLIVNSMPINVDNVYYTSLFQKIKPFLHKNAFFLKIRYLTQYFFKMTEKIQQLAVI